MIFKINAKLLRILVIALDGHWEADARGSLKEAKEKELENRENKKSMSVNTIKIRSKEVRRDGF
jgi:hypothetical protein